MLLKNRYLHTWAAALALALVATACSDEDSKVDPEPTTPGAVTITGLESGTVYNSVTFRVSAEEEGAVASVQIKIDDAVVATLTQAPFTYTLDTQTLEDGIHTVSAVVTDKAGTQHTAETNVSVRNTLLTVYVSEAVREYPYRAFIFLSDSLGNTLAAADYYDYQTGDSIRLTAPGFAGNTFYVTEVYINKKWAPAYVDAFTFTGIPRGTWNPVAKRAFSLANPAGVTAPLTLSNPMDGYSYLVLSNNTTFFLGQIPSSPKEINMSFINQESKLLVVAYHEGESAFQYSLVPSITAGQNAVVDLSSTLPATMGSLTFSNADHASVNVRAISGMGLYNIPNFGPSDDDLAEYGYPGDAFSRYNFVTSVRKNGEQFNTSQMGEPSTTLLQATVNLTLGGDGRTLSSVTTGTGLDLQTISINKVNKYYWSINSPPGTQTIVLPEFPELLHEFVIDDLMTDANVKITADDYDGINGYHGYVVFTQNFTGWAPDFTLYDYTYREKAKVISTESFGRINKASTPFYRSHPLVRGEW